MPPSVYDRHDHVVRSGGHLPRPKQIDVGSGDGIGHRSVVGIVPLLRKPRIVERQRGGSRRGRQRSRDGPLGPDTPDRIDRLDAPRSLRAATDRASPASRNAEESNQTSYQRSSPARRVRASKRPAGGKTRCIRVTPSAAMVRSNGSEPVCSPLRVFDDPLRNLSLFELDAKAPVAAVSCDGSPTGCGASLSDRIGGAGGQQRQRTKGDMQPAFLFE